MKFKNPFRNAKYVKAGYPVADYVREDFKRGDKAYVMSRGALMRFVQCPSKWLAGIKDNETKSTDWGNLVDCLALTGADFGRHYAIAPVTYPADGKKKGDPPLEKSWNWNATYCKEWREQQVGKDVITCGEYQSAKQAVAKLLDDKAISELIETSDVQAYCTADYHDFKTGLIVPFKILIDLLPWESSDYCNTIADLKTTQSAEPNSWEKSVYSFTYEVQAALQLDIFNQATGQERTDFRHVLQESHAPYQVAKRILSSEFLELGRTRYSAALAYYCQCLDSGVWPDYDSHSSKSYRGWQITEPKDWMVASIPEVPTLVEKVKQPEEERIDTDN